MALEPIEHEFARLSKRQKKVYEEVDDGLGHTIEMIDTLATSTSLAGPLLNKELVELSNRLKSVGKKHKELQGAISKMGKSIDKALQVDLSKIIKTDAFEGKGPNLNQCILEHFLQRGSLEVGKTFMKEATLELSQAKQDVYFQTHTVLQALDVKDVGPALRWVNDNRDELRTIGSELEFKLHRLEFVRLLIARQRADALAYANQHISRFAERHLKDIKRLMGCFLFPNQLAASRYADLVDPITWFEVRDSFIRESATLAGLPDESPVLVCVNAGCAALPELVKMASVLQDTSTKGVLMARDELPGEVESKGERLYHSVFACPVSRETASDSNPPMRLRCGHVICHDSLKKIAKGMRRKFKCTYCSSEQTLTECVQIKF